MSARLDSIVFASGNAGKLREIKQLLGSSVKVVAQSELGIADAEETGSTFVDNALIKARNALQVSGLPALADDSGLVVDALRGEPGVFSARYAGPTASDRQNIDKLLRELADVAEEHRGAAFHCTAVLLLPGVDEPLIASGEWRGRILDTLRGEGGFGYDPVFLDPESGLTAAQLDPDAKNARSHRGQALRRLIAAMRSRGL